MPSSQSVRLCIIIVGFKSTLSIKCLKYVKYHQLRAVCVSIWHRINDTAFCRHIISFLYPNSKKGMIVFLNTHVSYE